MKARTGTWTLSTLVAGLLVSSALQAQVPAAIDSGIERALAQGSVLPGRDYLAGITNSFRVEIAFEGEIRSAVFKTVDIDRRRRGFTHFKRGNPEIGFSDSYRYERAAYLLDRMLGIQMVPVAVLRRIRARKGALIAWIDGAYHPNGLDQEPSGPDMARVAQQKATMHLFDALILNTDRRPENWLIRTEDWKLFLIDHSRAFRERGKLPEEFLRSPARLTRALYRKLSELQESDLKQQLGGLIDLWQIRSLLARRDAIIDKIDRDLEKYGDSIVFSGEAQPSSAGGTGAACP